ncbi:hypothetical protein EXIGUO8H_21002 [Exiguobacterium sp. 8H]|nr:hypothetical protein EXIGUO8H_21002 [Exiguobacterium sp. 8H]
MIFHRIFKQSLKKCDVANQKVIEITDEFMKWTRLCFDFDIFLQRNVVYYYIYELHSIQLTEFLEICLTHRSRESYNGTQPYIVQDQSPGGNEHERMAVRTV